jgi:hypothetical protein
MSTEVSGPFGGATRCHTMPPWKPSDPPSSPTPTAPEAPVSDAGTGRPADLLAACGSGVTGLDPNVPTHDDRLFLAPAVQRTRLISLIYDVERLAREEPWIVQMPAPAKALEDTITEALLACLTPGQPSRGRAAPGRHRRIVARLDRALRERPEEMLSLSALLRRGRCRAENPEPRLPGVPRFGTHAIRAWAPAR